MRAVTRASSWRLLIVRPVTSSFSTVAAFAIETVAMVAGLKVDEATLGEVHS